MPKVVTSTELQKNTRAVIDWARTRGDAVIVETYSKPMVAILPFDKYQDYLRHKQKQKEARAERFERLRQFAERNAAFSGLSEEDASALVEEARTEVYQLEQERAGSPGADG
ncbi:MAG: hypothetical protein SXV54_22515 [Chloroflexota bacterium]|nr:hypothetical protein [Chloroflexota bacterium]